MYTNRYGAGRPCTGRLRHYTVEGECRVRKVLSARSREEAEGGALAEALPAEACAETDAQRWAREKREDSHLFFLKLRVAQLPKAQRECIQAHYYRGQTYQAIARERGVSEQCVAKTLSKAMKGLRKAYGIENA